MRRWTGLILIMLAVALFAAWQFERRGRLELAASNQSLSNRVAELEALTHRPVPNPKTPTATSSPDTNFVELLKLRGAVSVLRRELEALQKSAPPAGAGAQQNPQLAAALARSKIAYAQELLQTATAQFEAGVLTRNDLSQARATLEIAEAEARGDTGRVLQIKSELADAKLVEAEARHSVGAIANGEFERIRLERDVAQAELRGDRIEALRLKLEAANTVLRATQTRFEQGLGHADAVLRAELEKNIAEAEYSAATSSASN